MEQKSENNNQEVVKEVHPEVQKILEHKIPKRKIHQELVNETGELTIGDLIDEKQDIRFDKKTGKPMMMHSGVLAIWEGIGAELTEPKLEKTGKGEYQVIQGIRFADGSVFYATGESSEKNTDERELSGKFPVNQAHIRAINKAIVRGLGLYRVLLTEEEADEFKQPIAEKIRTEYEDKMKQLNQKWKEREGGLLRIIEGTLDLVSLPSESEKYANEYIIDIWRKHEDKEYIEELTQNENKMIAFVASQILKKIEKEKQNKETA